MLETGRGVLGNTFGGALRWYLPGLTLQADLAGGVGDFGSRTLVKWRCNQVLLVHDQEPKYLVVTNLLVVGLQRLVKGLVCGLGLHQGGHLRLERDKVVHEAELLLLVVERGRDEHFLLLGDLCLLCTDRLLL